MVDLRNRVAFAAGHVAGTLNFGLDGSFATYLGWLIPWGTPLTLLGETAEQVAEAQRELVRIGIDRPAAARHRHARPTGPATGELAHLPAGHASPTWPRSATTARSSCSTSAATWNGRDGHLDGAMHIPLHELRARLDEVPDGEVWVHCAAGYRASIAASMLAAAGRRVVARRRRLRPGPRRRMTARQGMLAP